MNLKKILKTHIAFIILFIVLGAYLGIKSFSESGWSSWYDGIGDAQTLLSAKHWANDGFFYSKFLAIPIGYSKTVRYLDDPQMRQHAHGTVTGGLIGQRLYYTHYPSGYSLPYAVFMKLGISQRHWFRLFALALSLGSLLLMYLFVNLAFGKKTAVFSSVYYSISTMFLGYADSLANQPIDDLLRFAILSLSFWVVSRGADIRNNHFFNSLIWILYFTLSVSSYDSTLFIFVWLAGLEIVILKKIPWKKLLFFGSAPVLGFVLQMFQNWWYLGNWKDVWLDGFGASTAKMQTGDVLAHLWSAFRVLDLASGISIAGTVVVLAIMMFSIFSLQKERVKNFGGLAGLLFLAGLAYPFIFVGSGGFSYQGKQMMPFVAIVVGVAGSLMFDFKAWKKEKIILVLAGVIMWSGQIYRTTSFVDDWPNVKTDERVIKLSKDLRSIKESDNVLFYTGGKLNINSVTEYYFDMPILKFDKAENLVNDYLWLREHSAFSFNGIIMADGKSSINEIKNIFIASNINPEEMLSIDGYHILKINFKKI